MESEIRCFILNQSEFSAFSAIISESRLPQQQKMKHNHKEKTQPNNNNNNKNKRENRNQMSLGHRVSVQVR